MLHPQVPRGLTKKLRHPWKGPFTVRGQLSELTYLVQPVGGRTTRVVHDSKLKPFNQHSPITLQLDGDADTSDETPPAVTPATATIPGSSSAAAAAAGSPELSRKISRGCAAGTNSPDHTGVRQPDRQTQKKRKYVALCSVVGSERHQSDTVSHW